MKITISLLLFFVANVNAATFTLINGDEPNTGINDSKIVSELQNNPGKTLGDQRKYTIEKALAYVGSQIDSNIDIKVQVKFDHLNCDATTGILGGASPTNSFSNFTNAPKNYVLYPSALAKLYSSTELDPGQPDIDFVFNGDIDFNDACLKGVNLYYGVDDQEPEGTINFYSVVLHETMHGLGFMTYIDANGQTPNNYSDPFLSNIFSLHSYRYILNGDPLFNYGAIGFFNSEVSMSSTSLLSGVETVGKYINGEPMRVPKLYNPYEYDQGSSISHWDTSIQPTPLMAPFAAEKPVVNFTQFELSAFKALGWPFIYKSPDRDGDGIDDVKDGFPDDEHKTQSTVLDVNNNNLPDDWEKNTNIPFLDPFADPDQDGLPNLLEFILGTDPLKNDTDGDGISDFIEYKLNLNPNDNTSCLLESCKSYYSHINDSKISISNPINYEMNFPDLGARKWPEETVKTLDNAFLISGSSGYTHFLTKVDLAGNIVKSFGQNGYARPKDLDAADGWTMIYHPKVDNLNRIYVATQDSTIRKIIDLGFNQVPVLSITFQRLLSDGTQDHEFQKFSLDLPSKYGEASFSYAITKNNQLMIAWEESLPGDFARYHLIKLNSEGVKDNTLCGSGECIVNQNTVSTFVPMITDNIGNIYFQYRSTDTLFIKKIDSNGDFDLSFGDNGSFSAPLSGSSATFLSYSISSRGLFFYYDPNIYNSGPMVSIYDYSGKFIQSKQLGLTKYQGYSGFNCSVSKNYQTCLMSTGQNPSAGYVKNSIYAFIFDKDFNLLNTFIQDISTNISNFQTDVLFNQINIEISDGYLIPVSYTRKFPNPATIGFRKLNTSTGWDLTFGVNGVSEISPPESLEQPRDFVVDNKDRSIVSFEHRLDYPNIEMGIARYFQNGDLDISFGSQGVIWPRYDGTKIDTINSLNFGNDKNIYFVGTISSQTYLFKLDPNQNNFNAAKVVYKFTKPKDTEFSYIDYIFSKNNELFLSFTFAKVVDANNFIYKSPTLNVVNIDNTGQLIVDLLPDGKINKTYQNSIYRSGAAFTSLKFKNDGSLEYLRAIPDSPYENSVSEYTHLKRNESVVDKKILFTLSNLIYPKEVLEIPGTNKYFVSALECKVFEYCADSTFQYFAIFDDSGNISKDFNGGFPIYRLANDRAHQLLNQKSYLKGNLIYVTTSFSNGMTQLDEYSDPISNGSSFEVLKLDTSGVLINKPIEMQLPGQQFLVNCKSTNDYSVKCPIYNNSFNNIIFMQWIDNAETKAVVNDLDNDGIPDDYEIANRLNPADPADASKDLDRDGVTNLLEYLMGTNPQTDDFAPVLQELPVLHINSTGPYTFVNIQKATAVDGDGNLVEITNDSKNYLAPGRNKINWFASDAFLNRSSKEQIIDVVPQIYLPKEMWLLAGARGVFNCYLNGYSPTRSAVTIQKRNFDTAGYLYYEPKQCTFNHTLDNPQDLGIRSIIPEFSFYFDNADGVSNSESVETKIYLTDSPSVQSVEASFLQNQKNNWIINPQAGLVDINLTLGNTVQQRDEIVDWTDNPTLKFVSQNNYPWTRTLDPSTLTAGIYTLKVKVKSSINDEIAFERNFKFKVSDNESDEDGDRVADDIDMDQRGFLMQISSDYWKTIFTTPNNKLRLGEASWRVGEIFPILTSAQSKDETGIDSHISGEIYDVEIYSLSRFGNSEELIVSLLKPLDKEKGLEVFISGKSWQPISLNEMNMIKSSRSISGACPSVKFGNYVNGLTKGNDCLYLLLEDGGPNDMDQQKNGIISFRGGLSEVIEPLVSSSSSFSAVSSKSSVQSSSFASSAAKSSSSANTVVPSSGGGGSKGGFLSLIDLFIMFLVVFVSRREKVLADTAL